MDSHVHEQICVFCNETLLQEATVILTEKGVSGILKAAEQRNEDLKNVFVGQKVHIKCGKKYTNPTRINA